MACTLRVTLNLQSQFSLEIMRCMLDCMNCCVCLSLRGASGLICLCIMLSLSSAKSHQHLRCKQHHGHLVIPMAWEGFHLSIKAEAQAFRLHHHCQQLENSYPHYSNCTTNTQHVCSWPRRPEYWVDSSIQQVSPMADYSATVPLGTRAWAQPLLYLWSASSP